MLLLLIRFGARPVCRSSAPVFKFRAGFRVYRGVPFCNDGRRVYRALLRRWYALRSILSDALAAAPFLLARGWRIVQPSAAETSQRLTSG
jgi:hypothetical protein